ncbi:MAG TPA: MerR family transcriptional regulator [Acidimicrobiales bacterium]|jgi:DNA-binding transcriptional MerR regulator|nr:MerR family transcriptional regulator [Acidimicrobiales bacterium]
MTETPSDERVGDPDGPAAADEPTTAEEPVEPVLTLAELAAASEVSERTIRYYQSEKLLPRPDKRGREAVYRPDHLERVRLIVDLRDRGLSLGTIRELVGTDDPTATVAAWLGVDATLRAPWSDDRPATLTLAELRDLVAGHPAGTLGELVDAGFVRGERDGTWTVPSPSLLDQALRLRAAGVDVDIAAALRDLLRRRLAKAVQDTVKLLVKRAGEGFAASADPADLAEAFDALRPVAREMASLILAQEVERALLHLAEDQPREIRARTSPPAP